MTSGSEPARPLSILLVEDEFFAAMLMKAELEKLGHRVVASVSTGENAVTKAQELRPDLVFMDIHLAGRLDGIKAASEIKGFLPAEFIFMTGYDDPAVRDRAALLKPLAYVIKPFAMANIRPLLDALSGDGPGR
jgi:CheY-like chemotaxis protein